jgi:hypothetical protein
MMHMERNKLLDFATVLPQTDGPWNHVRISQAYAAGAFQGFLSSVLAMLVGTFSSSITIVCTKPLACSIYSTMYTYFLQLIHTEIS